MSEKVSLSRSQIWSTFGCFNLVYLEWIMEQHLTFNKICVESAFLSIRWILFCFDHHPVLPLTHLNFFHLNYFAVNIQFELNLFIHHVCLQSASIDWKANSIGWKCANVCTFNKFLWFSWFFWLLLFLFLFLWFHLYSFSCKFSSYGLISCTTK